jgi:hypothetical protein
MRMRRWVYLTLGTLAWFVPQAVAGVQIASPGLGTVIPEKVLIALAAQTVALLTYPAGVVGMLAAMPVLFFGIATPIESLLISGPISLAAGYLQWFVVIPRLFGRSCHRPPAQKPADDASRSAAL